MGNSGLLPHTFLPQAANWRQEPPIQA